MVSIHGGPGSGKSRLAARLFSALRDHGLRAALILEREIKRRACLGAALSGVADQVAIFSDQLRDEEFWLGHADCVVTDSPLLTSVAYAWRDAHPLWPELVSVARKVAASRLGVDFFLDRSFPYENWGRFEDEHQAVRFDDLLYSFLTENAPGHLCVVNPADVEAALSYVLRRAS